MAMMVPRSTDLPAPFRFADNINQNSDLLRWAVAWFFLAVILVGGRVFIRTRLVKKFGWDDATMVMSMVLYTVYTTVLVVIVHWARHQRNEGPPTTLEDHKHGTAGLELPNNELFYARTLWQVQGLLYLITIGLTRVSVGLLFLRVIPVGTRTWARVTSHVMIYLTIVTTIATFFIDLFACTPIGSGPTNGGHCGSPATLPVTVVAYSVVGLVVDFTFALLPVAVLWGVQMKPGEKAAAICLMGVGCLASGTIIWRLVIAQVGNFVAIGRHNQPHMEPMKLQVDLLLAWTIEQSLGIIGASLATYKPLFQLLKTWYRSRVPAAGVFRRRRRPSPIGIPPAFPAPLGSPATPITPGENAYTRRIAQYRSSQVFELVNSASTIYSDLSAVEEEERPGPAVSPTFPEYVRTTSTQALISPIRSTTPTTPTRTRSTLATTCTGELTDKAAAAAERITTTTTNTTTASTATTAAGSTGSSTNPPPASPRHGEPRDFGQAPLPTIFSGQILTFSRTESTILSMPLDYSQLFREMPATLTESTIASSESSGDNTNAASTAPGVTRAS